MSEVGELLFSRVQSDSFGDGGDISFHMIINFVQQKKELEEVINLKNR